MDRPAWIDSLFVDPPASMRPQPQWVLNGALDPDRLRRQLEQFREQGCGGVFVCARTGMMAPYLGEEWFETWRRAVEHCRELGLGCQIYDEYICPAGYGGGEVIAADPGLTPIMLQAKLVEHGSPPAGCVACIDLSDGSRLSPNAAKDIDRPYIALHSLPMPARAGWAMLPYPDTAAPGSGATFRDVVHERYRRATPEDLGETVRFAFCDEPTLPHLHNAVLFSPSLRQAFQARFGYPLDEHVHLLFADGDGAAALRHDYYACCETLFNQHFFQPLASWCGALGLQLTGHVNEHTWPSPSGLPSAMAALRHFQAPGTDLLAFQFFPEDPANPRTRMALMNQRELDSIAKQCDRQFAMTETCGGGGYDFGLREMKALEDCCLALGVNLINPHIADSTLAGRGKYDWPQSISDHAPWFGDYRRQCDHNARVIAALSQGRNRQRLLVLQPTSSAWCAHRIGDEESIANIRTSQLDLLEVLDAHQVDYDLGDEGVIAELGRIDGTRFLVGACAYDAVLLPPSCENLRSACYALLQRWAATGQPLLALSPSPPSTIDGRDDERAAALADEPGWQAFSDSKPLLACIRSLMPPRICAEDGGPLPAGLLWRLHESEQGCVLFCCNPWQTRWKARIRLPYDRALKLHSDSGCTSPLALDGQILDCELPPSGHLLLYCGSELCPAAQVIDDRKAALIECRLQDVSPVEDNVVPLDYCRLQLGEQHWPNDCVCKQDEQLWQALGVEHVDKPFRDRHLNRHIPNLPVRLHYDVRLDETLDPIIDLGIERPWLWNISVNGQRCNCDAATVWFDHDWRRLAIGDFLRAGSNCIELHSKQCIWWHNPMPIYLLGAFALASGDAGWQLTKESDGLTLGDIGPQGRPCYPWGMRYRFLCRIETEHDSIELSLPDWHGSIAHCLLDGTAIGSIVHDHDRIICPAPGKGDHQLEVVVAGHLGNLMGPHHADGLPGRWTWLAAPRVQPPGSDYRRRAHGLLAAPRLESFRN